MTPPSPSCRAIARKWWRDARLCLRYGHRPFPAWWEAKAALLGCSGQYSEAEKVIRAVHASKRRL